MTSDNNSSRQSGPPCSQGRTKPIWESKVIHESNFRSQECRVFFKFAQKFQGHRLENRRNNFRTKGIKLILHYTVKLVICGFDKIVTKIYEIVIYKFLLKYMKLLFINIFTKVYKIVIYKNFYKNI